MSAKPSHRAAMNRPYEVSPQARAFLGRARRRLLSEAAARTAHWRERIQTQRRSLIRGLLVTHRRMFGISHKHVQANQRAAEQQAER